MSLDFYKNRGLHLNKMLAYQLAKAVPKEDFLKQLTDTWIAKWQTTSGAIDVSKELDEMRTRIKRSGYKKAFDNAKITDQDLVNCLEEAIRISGRSKRGGT